MVKVVEGGGGQRRGAVPPPVGRGVAVGRGRRLGRPVLRLDLAVNMARNPVTDLGGRGLTRGLRQRPTGDVG